MNRKLLLAAVASMAGLAVPAIDQEPNERKDALLRRSLVAIDKGADTKKWLEVGDLVWKNNLDRAEELVREMEEEVGI